MLVIILCLALASLACERSTDLAPTETAMATSAPVASSATEIPTAAALFVASGVRSGRHCQATGDLHLRTAPDDQAEVIGWLRAGERVTWIEDSGDWRAVITQDGVSGYAHGNWLVCGGE